MFFNQLDNVHSYKLEIENFNLNKIIKMKHKPKGLHLNVKLSGLNKDQQRLCNSQKRWGII